MTKKKRKGPRFADDDARRAYAAAWLSYLRVQPTPARIEELIAFVDDHEPRSPLAHVANHLVQQGQQPTREAVNLEQERRLRSTHSRRVSVLRKLAITKATVAEARTWVAAYVQDHGEGPLWSELGKHLGWGRDEVPYGVPELARRGAIHYTPVTRSMRPGPRPGSCVNVGPEPVGQDRPCPASDPQDL